MYYISSKDPYSYLIVFDFYWPTLGLISDVSQLPPPEVSLDTTRKSVVFALGLVAV